MNLIKLSLNRLPIALIAVLMALASLNAQAGRFDCSVVYDEFDHLMHAQFLVSPERYVETLDSLLTRSEFLEYQANKFKLREDRRGVGIGIILTNQKVRGKMIFSWVERPSEELVPFIVDEIIIFGRVSDGYAPHRLKSVFLTPGFAVDLDTGEVVQADDPSADMTYKFLNGQYVVEAISPARVVFPIESLCVGY